MSLLVSVIFAVTANADVTIEGDPNPYRVAVGDTLPLSFKKYLQIGENFVRWEIVSGTGTIIDPMADSTGFIPTSNSVVLRLITQKGLPISEIGDTPTKLYFYENCTMVSGDIYGIRMFFNAGAASKYAVVFTFNQSAFGISNYGTDSTFSNVVIDGVVHQIGRQYLIFEPNSKNYIFFYLAHMSRIIQSLDDYLTIAILPLASVEMSASGNGSAYIDSLGSKNTSYTLASRDSAKIVATADVDNKFDHWEIVSGSCAIRNVKSEQTWVADVQGDCKIRAVFTAGKIYTILNTPVQYNVKDHLYGDRVSSGQKGVRFTFTAPSSGSYTFVVSNEMSRDSLGYIRYTASDYKTTASTTKFKGSYSEAVNLTAGQVVGIIIADTLQNDNPFFISYSMRDYKLKLSAGPNGKVIPFDGYATAYAGAKYSIGAEGNAGFRFSDWQIVSGPAVIDDDKSPYTFTSISGDAELRALFKPSSICTLSLKKQTFNYQKDYYDESALSTIRFTWTPPDTNYYMLRYEPIDSMSALIGDYETDGSFTSPGFKRVVNGASEFIFKGTQKIPYYWTVQDSSNDIPSKSFNLWISHPHILNVIATKGGSVTPSEIIPIIPNTETSVTAWAHGGYKFDSWEVVEGNVTISSTKTFSTNVNVKDSASTIKAVFVKDDSAKPLLNISQYDLTNYPEVCATVTVSDAHTGYSFYGLDADDFVLTQDGFPIRPNVRNVYTYSGISVVIVVDESGSMEGDRMKNAKESIKIFVNSMGPYDRTAIVGFNGNAAAVVHQKMTSNKAQLLAAVDELAAMGGTNIVTGTYGGLQQIVNETNPTMLIVFSDGENSEKDNEKIDATVELAKSKNTPIFSIGLGRLIKVPLEDLAVRTGGTFTNANDADELGELYLTLRNKFLSQSVLCYQNPDTTQNADMHNVVISMTFNNITTKDSFQWSESALPPTILLTENSWDLIQNVQHANSSIAISAYISTSLAIRNANIFVRKSDTANAQFTSYAMRNVRDSLWEFNVPDSLVVAPGIDFYIVATDTAGQVGKSPKIQNPSTQPYTIFIDNDIPNITVVSVACEDSTSDEKTFRFSFKDSDGIYGARLFYKGVNETIYQEKPFAYTLESDTWINRVHMNVTEYAGFSYYLRVTDALGATVRYPETGSLTTDACEVKEVVTVDSIPTDSVPVDSFPPSPRDSVVYSLIADIAEMYDKDLDGRADYVRVHFKEERYDNITAVDSIFWNSNRGEWRFVAADAIKQNRTDGEWFEGYINKPYKYGLTKADSAHPPFLAFTSVHSDGLENVKLVDRVGAVPVKASKNPGRVGLKEYMNPDAEMPSDTLIVRLSEPVKNIGEEGGWEQLFRYSASCKDTVSQPIALKKAPTVRENGQVWTLILDGYSVKAGSCLFTDPSAAYMDLAGNGPGRGGVEIEGRDGSFYLGAVVPLQPVSGIGETPKWISPGGFGWEDLPDSLSAIGVQTMAPYKAGVYIFDGIGTYVASFKQEFGYDGEMEQPIRGVFGSQFRQGFLHWNLRSDKGRKAGTGIYVWKILFTFDDGHKETRIVKTGIYRRGHKKK